MNLEHLQTFLCVSNMTSTSFTKAAESLNVSKGLVSRHIQKLEDYLGTKLFHRTTRKLELTEAGQALWEKAQQIHMLSVEAEMRVNDLIHDLSGELKITAAPEFGQLLCRTVIPQFRAMYPDVGLHLNFEQEEKSVEFGDFDIAFRAVSSLPNDVVAIRLGSIRNVLVCSEQFRQQHPVEDIAGIQQLPFILHNYKSDWNTLTLKSIDTQLQMSVSGELSASNYQTAMTLAMQGLGIASLPFYQVERHIADKELCQLFPNWSVKAHQLSLLYAQKRVTPKKVTVFNQLVQSMLNQQSNYLLHDE